jgi:TM2 domain-containing membrane protein YozV
MGGAMWGRTALEAIPPAALGLALAVGVLVASPPAGAEPFRVGPVSGLLDLSVGYGLQVRTEEASPRFVGIGNGGNAPTVNLDDGTLNYGRGITANQIRATGELTLLWRNFGLFARGYGFYDFENSLGDRDHRPLTNDAKWLVGGGAELQDAFVTGRFKLADIPLVVRVGKQVINWGESGFIRFGVDIVNPIDFIAVTQPTTTSRDLFVRQGMVWGAATLTESVSVEAYYQYDWEPAVMNPTGGFFSANDLIGGDGIRPGFEGFGRFSDLGTDKNETYGLPDGTQPPEGGFDPDFMKIPSAGRHEPRDQGQFGFAVQTFLPFLNATKLGAHFASYHSRLPLISAHTASADIIMTSTPAGVLDRADDISDVTGLPIEETEPIAEEYTISDVANGTRIFATYPEDIRMVGASFSTATPRSGTLISGELSHHFGWPIQTLTEEVIAASLSPIEFSNSSTDAFKSTSLGVFGADEMVKGFFRTGKTQASLGVAQLLGPRIYSSQTILTVDVGWIRIDGLPDDFLFDTNSAGYRLTGALRYDGVFGGASLTPSLVFTHDFAGITPGPGTAFIEGRKSISAAVSLGFTNTWTSVLRYTNFFGAKKLDPGTDRDFLNFNVIYNY